MRPLKTRKPGSNRRLTARQCSEISGRLVEIAAQTGAKVFGVAQRADGGLKFEARFDDVSVTVFLDPGSNPDTLAHWHDAKRDLREYRLGSVNTSHHRKATTSAGTPEDFLPVFRKACGYVQDGSAFA